MTLPIEKDPSIASGNNSILPNVDNPDEVFAEITRNQFLDFLKEYGDFEDELIKKSQTDTSLIDQAKEAAAAAPGIATGIARRNAERYGLGLTGAQLQQRRRNIQLGGTLSGIQGVADARLNQREINKGMLADLINIGQGVNRSALSTMGSAAQNAADRKAAYSRARASARANTYSMLGSLGSMAIMSLAF